MTAVLRPNQACVPEVISYGFEAQSCVLHASPTPHSSEEGRRLHLLGLVCAFVRERPLVSDRPPAPGLLRQPDNGILTVDTEALPLAHRWGL